MATFRFQAKTASGQAKTGSLEAASATAAAATLRAQGMRVQSISAEMDEGDRGGFRETWQRINNRQPTTKHVLEFTTQLAVMIRAGINLRAALEGIAQQTTHYNFRKVLFGLKQDVESGLQFSDAIAKHPKLFNPLYVSMVRASEMSGSFSDMLNRIADYMAQQMETRKMVIGASIYPAIIGTLAVSVTVFLLTFVLPKFYTVFEGKEDVLPFATKFLMNLSNFMTAQWYFVVGGVVVLAVSLFLGLRTDTGKFWGDNLKLMVPVLRTMFRSLYISRGLQTMGQLINAGVPMLDTLRITGEVSGNILFSSMWAKVHASVKQGKKIATPLQEGKLLPTSVTQMISAGEESGKLGEVLDQISTFYAQRLREQIKALTSMIEPIMILGMGSIVGFIAMAIILPIFKMSSIVS